MRLWVEQIVLGLLYKLTIALRGMVWRTLRVRLIGVRALIVADNTVLLVRHRGGRRPWGLPGGAVERHERLPEAARRETLEESGVPVRVERLLGVYDLFDNGVSSYIAVFVGIPLGEQGSLRSFEIAEARFFPFNRLPEGIELGARRRITEYFEGEQAITSLW